MQRARYAKKKKSSGGGGGGGGGSSSSREEEIRSKAGLTREEYASLQPSSKAALEKAYASGSLTTTREARETKRFRLPDGTVTDTAGVQEFRKQERERQVQEFNTELVRRATPVVGLGGKEYIRTSEGLQPAPPPAQRPTRGGWSFGFGTPTGQLAIERVAGIESIRQTQTTTSTGYKGVGWLPGQTLPSSFKERVTAFFSRRPESSVTTTTTTEGRTDAGRFFLAQQTSTRRVTAGDRTFILQDRNFAPLAVSGGTFTRTATYTRGRESALGLTFRRADEGLAGVIPYQRENVLARFGEFRAARGDTSVNTLVGYTRLLGEKPATGGALTAVAVGTLFATRNPTATAQALRLGALGLSVGELYGQSQRQVASPLVFDTRIQNIASREAGFFDSFTLTRWGGDALTNELRQAGFSGGDLAEARAAALYEKRTRQGQFVVTAVVSGEAAANVIGGGLLPYTARAAGALGLGKLGGSIFTRATAYGVAGFYEGGITSIGLDISNRRSINAGRALKWGGIGFLTAGSGGALVGAVSAKFPKRTGFAEGGLGLIDAPFEQAGDYVSDTLVYGKTRLTTFTPAPESTGRTYDVSGVSVGLPSTSIRSGVPSVATFTPPARVPSTSFAQSFQLGSVTRISTPSVAPSPPSRGFAIAPITGEVAPFAPAVSPFAVTEVAVSPASVAPSVPVESIAPTVPTQDFPFLPGFGFGRGRRSFGVSSRSRSRRAYLPSLVARAFNIRGSRAQKRAGFLTGIGVRPL